MIAVSSPDMRPIVILVPVLAAALAATPAAHAEPAPRRHDVGLSVGLAADGVGDNGNPVTNAMAYATVGVEVGHRFRPGLRAHASLGYGTMGESETDGTTVELLIGGAALACRAGGRSCFGVVVDAGATHHDYDFGYDHAEVFAVLVEPKLAWARDLGEAWALRVAIGARWKGIVDGHYQFESGDPQDVEPEAVWGYSLRATFARRF